MFATESLLKRTGAQAREKFLSRHSKFTLKCAEWEAEAAALKNHFDEGINEQLKSAILIGMLPKEYQDMVLQTFAVSADFKFEGIRDYKNNTLKKRGSNKQIKNF